MRKLNVHQSTAIVNALINHELSSIPRAPIPGGQLFINHAHGLDVQAAIIYESRPVLRIGFATGDLALKIRFAELKHQATAVFVFCLINGQAVNLGQGPQGTGQAVAVGLDHTVINPFKGQVHVQVFRFAQDGNVEIRAVMPYGINSRIGERCPEILRHRFRDC